MGDVKPGGLPPFVCEPCTSLPSQSLSISWPDWVIKLLIRTSIDTQFQAKDEFSVILKPVGAFPWQ